MTTNEGTTDRILGAALGAVAILVAAFAGLTGALYWVALAVGAVLLITAMMGFCSAYRLLGLKTCRDC